MLVRLTGRHDIGDTIFTHALHTFKRTVKNYCLCLYDNSILIMFKCALLIE